jgi:hypothetical protein
MNNRTYTRSRSASVGFLGRSECGRDPKSCPRHLSYVSCIVSRLKIILGVFIYAFR